MSGCSGTSGDGLSSGKGDGCLRTLLRFSGNAAAPPVTTTQRVSRQLATWVSPVGGLRTLGAIRRDLPSLSSTASASARPLAGFLRLHRRQKLVATSAAALPGAWDRSSSSSPRSSSLSAPAPACRSNWQLDRQYQPAFPIFGSQRQLQTNPKRTTTIWGCAAFVVRSARRLA